MPDLPVLWVETPHINCILFLNGALIGETADSPSCSICRDGTVCLCLFPIASSQQFAALPYACSLHMRNGMPSHGLPEGAQLIFTAQGNLRLTISPHIYAPPQPEMPYGIGQVRFSHGDEPLLATLFYENGTKLCVEQAEGEGDILALLPLPTLRDGRVEAVSFQGRLEEDLLIVGESEEGPYACILDSSRGFSVIAEFHGNAHMQRGTLVCTRSLNSVLGHEHQTTLQYRAGDWRQSEVIGHFNQPPRRPKDDAECSLALCQCLALGQQEDAYALLSPNLRASLGQGELADFFGDFTSVEVLSTRGEIRLGLCYEVYDNVFRLREYTFAFESGKIDAVLDEEDDDFSKK